MSNSGVDASLLTDQRELFEIPADVTYLNCASMSPQLRAVTAAGLEAVRLKASPWTLTPAGWFSGSERLRALAAQLLHADAEGIALVPAASYGLAVAAANVPVRAGQTIVILHQQFPSNVYAWRALAARRDARIHTVHRGADGTWTDAVLAAIDEQTAVVAVPHCHWTDGSRLNLTAIGERVRAAGASLVVDASQSLGAHPLDVRSIQPDFLVSVGYKWLLGPYGLGYLYAAPRWRETGTPIENSWLSRAGAEDFARLDYTDEFRPGARRFDMGGFPRFAEVSMASAGLEQLLAWGVDRVQASLSVLTRHLDEGARTLGASTPPDGHRVGHMIGLRLPGGLPDGLAQALVESKIYVSQRRDSIRVSPHLYNDRADLDRFLNRLSDIVRVSASRRAPSPA
jgi:selenocysteine lyase/cysteine desulfurase